LNLRQMSALWNDNEADRPFGGRSGVSWGCLS
jgi:hypothetical protein